MNRLIAILLMFFSHVSFAQQKISNKDLKDLKCRLEGIFDNQEQASIDKSYSGLVLHVKEIDPVKKVKTEIVRAKKIKQKKEDVKEKTKTTKEESVEENDKGGFWLYAEQANFSSPRQPSFQRIIHLNKFDEDLIVLRMYEIQNGLQYAGAWETPEKLKGITMNELTDRKGCEIFLNKDKKGNFFGTTVGNDCISNLNGSSYAISEMSIYANFIITLDRGYDSNNNQVWGPEKGGYRFRKFTINK